MPTTKLVLNGTEARSDEFPPRTKKKLGDVIVFSDNIDSFQFPPGPTKNIPPGAGTPPMHSGFCFLLREPNVWLCQAGFLLPALDAPFNKGGQFQVRGLIDFDNPPFVTSITGGIDDFDGAGGRNDTTFPPANGGKPKTRWDLTIRTP